MHSCQKSFVEVEIFVITLIMMKKPINGILKLIQIVRQAKITILFIAQSEMESFTIINLQIKITTIKF